MGPRAWPVDLSFAFCDPVATENLRYIPVPDQGLIFLPLCHRPGAEVRAPPAARAGPTLTLFGSTSPEPGLPPSCLACWDPAGQPHPPGGLVLLPRPGPWPCWRVPVFLSGDFFYSLHDSFHVAKPSLGQ